MQTTNIKNKQLLYGGKIFYDHPGMIPKPTMSSLNKRNKAKAIPIIHCVANIQLTIFTIAVWLTFNKLLNIHMIAMC